jgi:hypothetical protein
MSDKELNKEEILYKHHEWSSPEIEAAMDEYTKQVACAFLRRMRLIAPVGHSAEPEDLYDEFIKRYQNKDK